MTFKGLFQPKAFYSSVLLHGGCSEQEAKLCLNCCLQDWWHRRWPHTAGPTAAWTGHSVDGGDGWLEPSFLEELAPCD